MAAKATQAAKAAAGKAVKAAQAARAAQAGRATGAARAGGPGATADYDAIVVGGGQNGLVAAAYLARSGAWTLVLEARPKTGGAATTEAPWPDAPDFRVTRLSYVMSLLPPTIINDLQLDKHGYKIFPMGPYYQAFPEGGSIKLYADDAKRNHHEGFPLVEKGRRRDAALGRLAGRAGRRGGRCCRSPCRRTWGSRKSPRPQGNPAAGLAPPQPGRAHDRRR